MKIRSEGDNEFERFDNVIGKLLSVSKKELDRRIAADPRGHSGQKKKKRKPAKVSASRASAAALRGHKV